MKKALLIIGLLLLAACTQQITTIEDAYGEVEELDEKYNTSIDKERVNKMMIDREGIVNYLNDMEGLVNRTEPATEKDEKWIRLLYEYREQSLNSQYLFQEAWLGIGDKGLVSDGFKCSDYPQVSKMTQLMEKASRTGFNATKIMDVLLTESSFLQEKLGINDDKPEIYDSSFEKINIEIRSNVVAMHNYCDLEVPTKFDINFNKTNQTGVIANATGNT